MLPDPGLLHPQISPELQEAALNLMQARLSPPNRQLKHSSDKEAHGHMP
jgi:hypothetical protein